MATLYLRSIWTKAIRKQSLFCLSYDQRQKTLKAPIAHTIYKQWSSQRSIVVVMTSVLAAKVSWWIQDQTSRAICLPRPAMKTRSHFLKVDIGNKTSVHTSATLNLFWWMCKVNLEQVDCLWHSKVVQVGWIWQPTCGSILLGPGQCWKKEGRRVKKKQFVKSFSVFPISNVALVVI